MERNYTILVFVISEFCYILNVKTNKETNMHMIALSSSQSSCTFLWASVHILTYKYQNDIGNLFQIGNETVLMMDIFHSNGVENIIFEKGNGVLIIQFCLQSTLALVQNKRCLWQEHRLNMNQHWIH